MHGTGGENGQKFQIGYGEHDDMDWTPELAQPFHGQV
jgi:hypothetical protein